MMTSADKAPVPVDVSVTIANWNRAELLERCLRSIGTTKPAITYEVIVVDNASSDRSVQMVRGQFPNVRLIVNTENRGFGPAHNQALAAAAGRYVLALNNDAAVQPETIPTLVALMDRYPRAGIGSCPAYLRHPSSTEFTARAFRQFPSVSGALWLNLWELCRPLLGRERRPEEPIHGDAVEVAWVTGALLVVRREMVEQIGYFDERFFLFFEEVDLCRRARSAGWTVLFTTSTCYVHQQGASRELRADSQRLFGESGAKYFLKHHGPLAAAAFRLQHDCLRRGLLPWRVKIGAMVRSLTSQDQGSGGKPRAGAAGQG